MTCFRIEFGPAWNVPPLTIDYTDPNKAAREVAEHAKPHLERALTEKGHPEYADCFFQTNSEMTVGEFLWLDLATGRGARFCPARLTPAAPAPASRGFCPHGEEEQRGCLLAPGHDGDHLPSDPPEADEAIQPPSRADRAELDYPRRVTDTVGTVHAARYAPGGFTTACAVYPALTADRIDASHAQLVTCRGCQEALDAGVVRSHGPVIPEQHVGATEPLGTALGAQPGPTLTRRLMAALTGRENTR